jgi:hypothetical protein
LFEFEHCTPAQQGKQQGTGRSFAEPANTANVIVRASIAIILFIMFSKKRFKVTAMEVS